MPFFNCSNCSPEFKWAPYNENSCYRIATTAATAPTNAVVLQRTSFSTYSRLGTKFYNSSFNSNGTGSTSYIFSTPLAGGSYTGTLWANPLQVSTQTPTSGPLNRSAVWYSSATITYTWLGFSTCLQGISTGKTYYVGLGADNEYRLVLDGVEILNTYTPATSGLTATFQWWNVYPVFLSEGDHTLELYGLDQGSFAGFGMEIYDNTLSELTAATTVNDINIIFSSSGYTTADVVQTLSGTYLSSGYTCPTGFVYTSCDGDCWKYVFCYAPTPTPTRTPTKTPISTSTQTPTNTPTYTQTPSNTPTYTQTPTPSQTTPVKTVQFRSCEDGKQFFRFRGNSLPTTTGETYYIAGSKEYEGCATIVENDGSGFMFDSAGVTFTLVADCGDSLCPRTDIVSAVFTKCSDGSVTYFNVDADTAFLGATYSYSGDCYSFERFEGPGGPYINSPIYKDCSSCVPIPVEFTPTPTPTPFVTPTITPSISSTPASCSYSAFCLSTNVVSLSGYNGNYLNTGLQYNSRLYYTGGGMTTSFIYFTGEKWCLSDSLGGVCLLDGNNSSYSSCPDLSQNIFQNGICPTPTPTPQTLNFEAYFDVDYEPLPTPSLTVDNLGISISSVGLTPTPTVTSTGYFNLGFALRSVNIPTQPPPSQTPTQTMTPSNKSPIYGKVTFNIVDPQLLCPKVVSVLIDCVNGNQYYVPSLPQYNGVSLVPGFFMNANVNGTNRCVEFLLNSTNLTPNSNVTVINSIHNNCSNCP